MRGGLSRLGLALALLGVAAGACAPPPPPRPVVNDRAALYRAGRDKRAAFLGALTAEVVVRLSGRSIGRLPALSASLSLAAPDRARLVADAVIGVAVDACAMGDSLVIWVPSERTAFQLGGSDQPLEFGSPVALFTQALGATWDPPVAAWAATVPDSEGVLLAWRAGADSLALVVGGDGLPVAAVLTRSGESVRVRYGAWTRVRGESWPARVELTESRSRVRLRLDVAEVRLADRADDRWFVQRIPAGARRLDGEALRALLGGDGAVR